MIATYHRRKKAFAILCLLSYLLAHPACAPILTILATVLDGNHEVEVVLPKAQSGLQVVLCHERDEVQAPPFHQHGILTTSILTLSATSDTTDQNHLISFAKAHPATRSQVQHLSIAQSASEKNAIEISETLRRHVSDYRAVRPTPSPPLLLLATEIVGPIVLRI